MVYDKSLWLKSYDDDVSPEIELTDSSTPQKLEVIRKNYGSYPAVHFLGRTLTFDELFGYADRFARCLADHGLGKGDVVGVCLPNSPQYLITMLGGLKAGCGVSGVSPLMTPDEIAYQLKDCGAKAFVVMDAIHEHRFAKIADQTPDVKLVMPTMLLDFLPKFKQLIAKWLKKVPTGKAVPVQGAKVVPFMKALSDHAPDPPSVELTRDDPCFIQYTGGTTGLPKGAILTHGNMLSTISQFDEWFKVERGKEVVASAYPMFHIAGLFTAMNSLAFGCAQVLIPNPRDTKLIVKQMAKYKPQWTANVPSLYMMLMREPGFRELDFSTLRVCLSAAAPMPAEGIKELESVVGKGKVVEIYGMTETSPLSAIMPLRGVHKINSVGVPPPSTLAKIMDLETGAKEVPIGEVGEIAIHGPQVMKGYHNKPQETSYALREHDGKLWMYTGDIGLMDEDGYITLVDRQKDMISVGGYKVFPREVEDKLYEHPAVEMCAIVGAPNPERPETELVKMFVQRSPAFADTPEDKLRAELQAYAKERVAPFKVPKVIEFAELPLTAAGKVDKKALRSSKG